jgi:ribosomal protein S18 acetylase RimI-like enzyme
MIKVRSAVPADYSLIVDFQIKMAFETEGINLAENRLTQGVLAVFAQPEKGQYFIAETAGKACASLLITYEWSDWRNSTIWWIQSVYVMPEFRQKGVYKAMYAYVKQLAEANKQIGGIRLYVDKTNQTAQKAYAALGMNGDHYQVFEWMKP